MKRFAWLILSMMAIGCAAPMNVNVPSESDPDFIPTGATREQVTVAPQGPSVRQNQIIVALKPGARLTQATEQSTIQLKQRYCVVTLPAGMTVAQGRALYAKNPAVNQVLENRVYSANAISEPMFADQWACQSNRINLESAYARNIDASNLTVAVLDSGLDYNHPEFTGRVLRGWNFVDHSSDVMDRMGHGTHVAGIIGAAGHNGQGIAGVANCKLMAVKVLNDKGEGSTDALAAAIKYAADYNAKVINLSLGSSDTTPDPVLQEAIAYAYEKGCLIVAASGNTHSAVGYPACDSHVMAVSSTSQFARWEYISWFSNRGPEVAVAAPGGSILSTLPLSANSTGEVGYGRLSGTSMACPFVSGEAALIFAQHPNWTAQQVYNRIISTADSKGSRSNTYGYGRINIGRAVAQ